MELVLPKRTNGQGEIVPARTLSFDPGELALLEYPWKRRRYTLIFGVAKEATFGQGAAALVVQPSYTLGDLVSLGGILLPDFQLNRRQADRFMPEDLARRQYSPSLIRELYIGSSAEIAAALRKNWPEKEVYARIIETMKAPYEWIHS